MPTLQIGSKKSVSFNNGENLVLKHNFEPTKFIELCAEQAAELFINLETIESKAKTFWLGLNIDEKHEYYCHLGWDIFLVIVSFDGKCYYDIRKFSQNGRSIKATPRGLKLSSNEALQLRNYSTIIVSTVPDIQNAEECECEEILLCRRCAPFV